MFVLVDSSVWVAHFKHRNQRLVKLLEAGLVISHPYVILELACGTPPNRREIIAMLGELESAPVATYEELLHFITLRQLQGRGCGMVDLALLAAVLIRENTLLWTLDKRLRILASDLKCADIF
jgi:predicted nucleic acid-binding protein